jgi:hypothetical protein
MSHGNPQSPFASEPSELHQGHQHAGRLSKLSPKNGQTCQGCNRSVVHTSSTLPPLSPLSTPASLQQVLNEKSRGGGRCRAGVLTSQELRGGQAPSAVLSTSPASGRPSTFAAISTSGGCTPVPTPPHKVCISSRDTGEGCVNGADASAGSCCMPVGTEATIGAHSAGLLALPSAPAHHRSSSHVKTDSGGGSLHEDRHSLSPSPPTPSSLVDTTLAHSARQKDPAHTSIKVLAPLAKKASLSRARKIKHTGSDSEDLRIRMARMHAEPHNPGKACPIAVGTRGSKAVSAPLVPQQLQHGRLDPLGDQGCLQARIRFGKVPSADKAHASFPSERTSAIKCAERLSVRPIRDKLRRDMVRDAAQRHSATGLPANGVLHLAWQCCELRVFMCHIVFCTWKAPQFERSSLASRGLTFGR